MTDAAAMQAASAGPLTLEELQLTDAYWRAANYLSVGQIYLLDNPLLREPCGVRKSICSLEGASELARRS